MKPIELSEIHQIARKYQKHQQEKKASFFSFIYNHNPIHDKLAQELKEFKTQDSDEIFSKMINIVSRAKSTESYLVSLIVTKFCEKANTRIGLRNENRGEGGYKPIHEIVDSMKLVLSRSEKSAIPLPQI